MSIEKELKNLDYCRYLKHCGEIDDNTLEDYCVENYTECPQYRRYKLQLKEIKRKYGRR
ncbi:hypothetical protein CCP1ISM_60043 [Azospirillaceae bacterium]